MTKKNHGFKLNANQKTYCVVLDRSDLAIGLVKFSKHLIQTQQKLKYFRYRDKANRYAWRSTRVILKKSGADFGLSSSDLEESKEALAFSYGKSKIFYI